jgi:protein-disulfide isomerase
MKKNLSETQEKKTEPSKPQSKKEYLEIRLPSISFKDTKINTYLVTALIIFAFFLGMLTNKVLSLEKALKTQTTNNIDPTAQINNNVLGNTDSAPQVPTQPPPKVDVAIGHLPTLGSDKAKVTVIEFSDFQCPYCVKFARDAYPQIYDAYIKTNKIKFAYRHYPLVTIHTNAQKAAEASECANEQNKFWDYHDLLFKNQTTWSPQLPANAADSFTGYAGQLGLNTDQFRSCLDTDKYKELVQGDITDGYNAGVDGTPTLFINGWRIVGAVPFPQIQKLIEQELKK